MQTITLGRTGIRVSRIAFGAGPVSGLMTGDDEALQLATLSQALNCGINWIDTAAGYGQGSSESNLGRALKQLPRALTAPVHIATKVRIDLSSTVDFRSQVMTSLEQSLRRLGRSHVTLLQLHNGVTKQPGEQAASLAIDQVLGQAGAVAALEYVRTCGLVSHIGLTGTGTPAALRAAICSGLFETIQLPYNRLNPSAGREMPADFVESNYGNILADCQAFEMGAFAIRVFAGGALLGAPPSPHTHKTPYFPLDLYQRDTALAAREFEGMSMEQRVRQAIDFAVGHPAIHSAIIGFGSPDQVTVARDAFH